MPNTTLQANPYADYATAKHFKLLLEVELSEASRHLQSFLKGPMGLTPDAVKATPEWKEASGRYLLASAELRGFNSVYCRRFARVKIRDTETLGWLKNYIGQECDAIFYDDGHAQLNTEQLSPPLPKWQSVRQTQVQELAS